MGLFDKGEKKMTLMRVICVVGTSALSMSIAIAFAYAGLSLSLGIVVGATCGVIVARALCVK